MTGSPTKPPKPPLTLDRTPGLANRADTAELGREWAKIGKLESKAKRDSAKLALRKAKIANLAAFINEATDLHTPPARSVIQNGLAELRYFNLRLRDGLAQAGMAVLPDEPFPIYRGAHAQEKTAGMCWTIDEARAIEYARNGGQGAKVWTVERVTVAEIDGILCDTGEVTIVANEAWHSWQAIETEVR